MSNTTLLLIAIAVIMIAAVPTAMVLKDFLPGFIERSSNVDQIENRIYVLHAELHELQDRVAGLTARRNQQSNEKSRAESDVRKMERAIQDLASQPPLFVHEVGDPKAGMSKFTVNLTYEKASSGSRNSGERQVQVNPIWRCTNVAEVWANTHEEAKQAVEVSFPFKLGFLKTFAPRPKATERLPPKAVEATRPETGATGA